MVTASLRDEIAALGIDPVRCTRVLLVDDQPENLVVLEALLEDDWDVQCADSAKEALELIASDGAPDIIISDQRMPEMTGVQLLTQVAAKHPATIRMVLTGYTEVGPMVAAVNEGAVSRFMFKPWDAAQMRAAVVQAAELKESRSNLRLLVQSLSERRVQLRATLGANRIAHAQLAAAERLSTLGRLTAGITHELRNQLAVMVMLVGEVRLISQRPEVLGPAEAALRSLRSLLALVEDVNAFARSQALSLDKTLVSVERLVEDSLRFLRIDPAVGSKQLEVSIDSGAGVVEVDVHRLRQSLLVLLRNAAMAGATVIEIRARVDAGFVLFEVIDDGVGMDEATLERAKEAFFGRFGGDSLGIGLGIADLVADSHGGTLELRSTLGHGTVAQLRIPVPE
ncbi:MAG: signal transduction histidine kinase [Bradymonadia bacterium]